MGTVADMTMDSIEKIVYAFDHDLPVRIEFKDQLKRKELDFRINGSHNRIPGSLSLSFKSTDGEMLLHRLDLMGTAVATGSACNSKDTVLSHVIQAISVPQEYAHGTIRVTLGMDNTVEQVDRIAQQIASILR